MTPTLERAHVVANAVFVGILKPSALSTARGLTTTTPSTLAGLPRIGFGGLQVCRRRSLLLGRRGFIVRLCQRRHHRQRHSRNCRHHRCRHKSFPHQHTPSFLRLARKHRPEYLAPPSLLVPVQLSPIKGQPPCQRFCPVRAPKPCKKGTIRHETVQALQEGGAVRALSCRSV